MTISGYTPGDNSLLLQAQMSEGVNMAAHNVNKFTHGISFPRAIYKAGVRPAFAVTSLPALTYGCAFHFEGS